MRRYSARISDLSGVERLAALQTEQETRRMMEESDASKGLRAGVGIFNSIMNWRKGKEILQSQKEARDEENRMELIVKGFTESDTGKIRAAGRLWNPPEQKPAMQKETMEWFEPDKQSQTGYSYVRLTADNMGKLQENRQPASRAAYENHLKKSGDFHGTTSEERQTEKYLYDLGVAKNTWTTDKEGRLVSAGINRNWPALYEAAKKRYAKRQDILDRIELINFSGIINRPGGNDMIPHREE